MSTLYIRLPLRTTINSAAALPMPDCRFALISEQGRIVDQGTNQLSGLAEHIGAATRVVLIVAAGDVNLLRLPIPPLSDTKLRLALPNLVEEHLLTDPHDCVIVASRKSNGSNGNLRLIAVVQRDWLALIVKTVLSLGANKLVALPAQLCLPLPEAGTAVAAVTDYGADMDVTLRLAENDGMGWLISPLPGQSAAQAVLYGLTTIVPHQLVTLYVDESSRSAYEELGDEQVTVIPDEWERWVGGAQKLTKSGGLDLMDGLTVRGARTDVNWRRWRWPLGLATALLLVNIFSLNVEWWRMRREASSIRADMAQSYLVAYPNESVIIDPIAQMKQKIALMERRSGQLGADDFLVLTAGFGQAWAALPRSAGKNAIIALEYHDRSLLVRLKNAAEANAIEVQMRSALEANQLTLIKPTSGIWQIRSIK
ncbi:type II secretion system protein GspL [Glaciimonas sp. CA11.2]|uniref:type II secretion system protein GspL n=1 Tax=Glaciimonas sp. CA11.2 TaxID=3048601 RepID=UPI002AB430B5|nr:type II secretion system protein GspL [Glaciimonas sp. CA11.2]MDY7548313.1 type II secretion system protein GspL [Glaciimonas sp. CA11.2]